MDLTFPRWKRSYWCVHVGYQFVAKSACSERRRDAALVSTVSWRDTDAEWYCERSGLFQHNDNLDALDSIDTGTAREELCDS
jgi:hypothetical protein